MKPQIRAHAIKPITVLLLAFSFTFGVLQPGHVLADCGCATMTLAVAGNSSVFCTVEQGDHLDAPGCVGSSQPGTQGCPIDRYASWCPLGRFVPQAGALDLEFGFTFQATATVTAGSNAEECATGQYVAGSMTINGQPVDFPLADVPAAGANDLGGGLVVTGVAYPTPIPPLPVPADRADPTMGADGYMGTEEIDDVRYRIDGNEIRFLDAPKNEIDAMADVNVQDLQFVTYVKPNVATGNSCWCRFSLAQTWENQQATGAGIAAVGTSHNCTIP